MTSRTDDYRCPRCHRYLFSAYTVHMTEAERKALDERAAKQCKCKGNAGVGELPAERTLREQEARWEAKFAADDAGVMGTKPDRWPGATGADAKAAFDEMNGAGTWNRTGFEPTDLNSFQAGATWAWQQYTKWADSNGVQGTSKNQEADHG